MDALAPLFLDIVAFDPDRRRVNHLLKVAGFGDAIAEAENLPADKRLLVRAACLLHDLGIKASLEKYGSAEGRFQHLEGPGPARAMLEEHGFRPEFVARICYLIAHHHDYDGIDDLDYRILVEADFLVNCDEGGYDRERVAAIRAAHFRTASGTRLLDALFGVGEAGA